MPEEQLLEESVSLKNLPYELNEELRVRAAVGLVVLATDQVIEHEYGRILNIPGVALFKSRIRNETRINRNTLAAMELRLAEAVDLILPGMPSILHMMLTVQVLTIVLVYVVVVQ